MGTDEPKRARVRLTDGEIVDVLERPVDPTHEELLDMDMAGNYEAPFAPATSSGAVCVCVCCGAQQAADHEISQYPFRYIPQGWSVNATNRALRCKNCVHRGKTEPLFVSQNDVWVDYMQPDPYGHGKTGVQVTVQRHQDPVRRDLDHRLDHRGRAMIRVPRPEDGLATGLTERFADHEHVVASPPLQDAYEQHQEITMPHAEDAQEVPETRREAARRLGHETRTDRVKRQAKQVGGAVGQGFALAAANEAGEVFVDIAKELTSELPMAQLALDHPDGRELAKVLVALMLHTATEQSSIIPQGEFIGEACKLQMTASTFTLVGPRLNRVRKHLTKLAKIGEQTSTGAIRARVEPEDEDLAEAYAEMEAELNEMKAKMAALEAEEEEERASGKKPRARKGR